MRKGDWLNLGARDDAISLSRTSSGDQENVNLARAFLEFGNGVLLRKADQSRDSGDLRSAAWQYEELLGAPWLSWETKSHAERALRDSLFTLGLQSYGAHAWNDAAEALSDYADHSIANDLRNKDTVEMLANSLMKAALSDYSKHNWSRASYGFQKLVENSTDSSPGSSTAVNAVWSEFNKYVHSVPGLRAEANLYWKRAKHLSDAKDMPSDIAFIDEISSDFTEVSAPASPERRRTLHVFNSTGDLNMIVSEADLHRTLDGVGSGPPASRSRLFRPWCSHWPPTRPSKNRQRCSAFFPAVWSGTPALFKMQPKAYTL